jgi:hypothetical protein
VTQAASARIGGRHATKKKMGVEILPASQAALAPNAPAANVRALMDSMVRESMEQIMAEPGASRLQPDFQSREVSDELRRQQAVFERGKWGLYFKKWGCRRCGRKKVNHASSGHGGRCCSLLGGRLAQIKREWIRDKPDAQIAEDIDRLTVAVSKCRNSSGKATYSRQGAELRWNRRNAIIKQTSL